MKNILLLALVGLAAVGCSNGETAMTKQEEADFRGKPIPPEALEKMKANAARPPAAPTSP